MVLMRNYKDDSLTLRTLSTNDIDDIMNLQTEVYDKLDNKELYSCSDADHFNTIIKDLGVVMGYYNRRNELVAMAAYAAYGRDEENYGYDLEIADSMLDTVGQIESVLVHPSYRGRGLQKRLCIELESSARRDNMKILAATVSPINSFSLNNFISIGYETRLEKLKYGGLRRYVLTKNL